MTNENKRNWFKGALAVFLMLVKGFLLPASVGVIGYTVSYPLMSYSCKAYAESIEKPYKFRWWSCYLQGSDGRWLSKQEYQMSEVGTKLILVPELPNVFGH